MGKASPSLPESFSAPPPIPFYSLLVNFISSAFPGGRLTFQRWISLVTPSNPSIRLTQCSQPTALIFLKLKWDLYPPVELQGIC